MKTKLLSKVFWTQATAVIMIASMLLAALPVQTASAASSATPIVEPSCKSPAVKITGSPALTAPGDPLTLTKLSPDYAAEGGPAFTLTVTGTGFRTGDFHSIVLWEEAEFITELTTHVVSSTELTAEVPAELIDIAHKVPFVYVCNPTNRPGAANSAANFGSAFVGADMSEGLPFFITKTGAEVTGFNMGTGLDPSASFEGVTADGIGNGTLVVAQYAANPAGESLLFSVDEQFYDVHIGTPNTFTQVTIQFCGVANMGPIYFWNGTEWVQASNQSYGPGLCMTVFVDNFTVPSLADLAGGLFGAGGGNFGRHSFSDVSPIHWAWSWVNRLADAGITTGCGILLQFCPEDPVTRAQMAIFLERGMNGWAYTPPAATGLVFWDVLTSTWAADWIENLYADGITTGCGGGKYCPGSNVTRAEMAKFLLLAKHGSTYTPPAVGTSTGFADVSTSHWAAAWIKQLAAEGITTIPAGGNYLPESLVTRAEMAKFLVITFDLP